MYANACSVFDNARSDLDQALTYRCELSLGQRTGLRDGGAHAMHQPEGRGVEDEPHLIGGRVMARHAVREELRLVQFDQVSTPEQKCIGRPAQKCVTGSEATEGVLSGTDGGLLGRASGQAPRLRRAATRLRGLTSRRDRANPPSVPLSTSSVASGPLLILSPPGISARPSKSSQGPWGSPSMGRLPPPSPS